MWIKPNRANGLTDRSVTQTDPILERLLALDVPAQLEVLEPRAGLERNRLRQRALELSSAGAVEIEWTCFAPGAIAHRGREQDNVAGEAREREAHREWFRFLDPLAPNHSLKQLEARLYLERICPHLDALGPNPRVLDLGGGTGRLALPLARRGALVTLVDPNPAALADAAEALAETSLDLSIGLASAYEVPLLGSGAFDAVLSIEVLCYLENPELAAAELARLLRPGGIGFISVEAWPGGLLSARDTSASEVTRVIESRTLHRPGDLFVRYFDRGALECLVTGAGLELVALRSHHHALEGPWSTVIADLDIGRATDEAEILRLEQALGADSEIGELGRGWLAIARKP